MKKQYIIPIVLILIIGISIFLIFFFNKKEIDNKILVENSYITILNNSEYYFKAMCIKAGCSLTYKSNDENIFTVNESGEIIALDKGEAILSIESENVKKEVAINVTDIESMITGINIKEENINMQINEKHLLEIEHFPNRAVLENITWSSSDIDVLTVTDGYIEAKNEGQAIVTVTVNNTDIIDSINIKVGKGATEKVESVDFEQEVVTMGLNESYQLEPIIKPINAEDKKLTYIVEDENIIDINENGLITSKAKGKTNVNVISSNGAGTSIEVKVESSMTDLVLNTDEVIIAKGENYQLKSNYVSGIEWYSSNNKVVTVNSNGLLKGISNGEAIITVINKYGRINTTKVVVKGSGIPVSKIILDKTELSLKPGSNYKMTVSILPTNATNKDLIWETSDSRIATVSDDGTIVALRTGEAMITAYSGSKVQSSVKVNVSSTAISADSLEISPESIILLKGDTFNLKTKIIPSNVTNKDVIWETSDSSVVSIDEFGLIKAHKTGMVVITATSNGLTSKASVEVKSNVVEITSVSINEKDLTLKVGQKVELTANYLPQNATNKKFIWDSNNDVVSISNSGLVTALKAGTSTITVKSTNGKSDSIKITVDNTSSGGTTNPNDTSVSEVLLNLENINIHIGQTKQLKATVLPLNAINSSLTWISGNESVATISSSGLVTGINPGTTQISVITANGKVAKTSVTVTHPPIYDEGDKSLEIYSDKLIVTMTKNSNTGINVIRVWVADPYKQFHKIDSKNELGDTVSSLLSSAITQRNLTNSILIGGNAMFTKNGRRIGNFAITEGYTWLNDPGGPNGRDEASNSLFYAGIGSDGILRIYCTNPERGCNGKTTEEAEKPVFQNIIRDGVRNTIVLPYEHLFINNGKKTDTSWDTRTAIRHSLCQVNKNNFVITISTRGNTKAQHQAIQLNAGCFTGINLDGGGSANVFFKNRGTNLISPVRTTTRKRPDAIYFSEY